MQRLKTFLTVIGAVTVLVLAANTAAYAATGGKFILGKTNKANKVSTLKRTTSGSALNLVTKSSANAPMTVNGKGKVVNLNADLLDGLDSSALKTQTYRYTIPTQTSVTAFNVDFPGLPAGTYLATYDLYATSGGGVSAICYFRHPTLGQYNMVADGALYGTGTLTMNATGVLTTSYASRLHCETTGGSITLGQAYGRTVSFTRIDSLGSGTGAGARLAGGSSSRLVPGR